MRPTSSLALLLLLASTFTWAGGDDDDDDEAEDIAPARMKMEMDFAPLEISAPAMPAPMAAPGSFSARVGGSGDIEDLYLALAQGILPEPGVLRPEGLFAMHDLPTRKTGPCDVTLCLLGEVSAAPPPAVAPAQALVMLGFDTNLPLEGWSRPPMHVAVVIDADPALVQHGGGGLVGAMLGLQANLGPQDTLSLVSAGREQAVYAQALAGDDQGGWITAARRVALSAEGQVSQGVARAARLLQETSPPGHLMRVLVLSTGAPHRMGAAPETLKAQAVTLAESGIGVTAVSFGGGLDTAGMAALAGAKGGAFGRAPSLEGVARVFGEDFEALFVPLVYRFGLEISPASGWRLSGVFGVPEAALTWDSAGVARLTVETLFVSRKRGAIYLTFAPEGVSGMPPAPLREGSALAEVRLSYQQLSGEWIVGTRRLAPEPMELESTGLRDGRALIQWLVTMREALAQHQAGDVDGALSRLAEMGWGPTEAARFPKEYAAWLETLALMQAR
ncbi:MAG: hypothetical protein IPI35_26590 [Deltaproteobacteria bacterium]|nr:hypothetical protein [Deltaproteobacteria bacterium]